MSALTLEMLDATIADTMRLTKGMPVELLVSPAMWLAIIQNAEPAPQHGISAFAGLPLHERHELAWDEWVALDNKGNAVAGNGDEVRLRFVAKIWRHAQRSVLSNPESKSDKGWGHPS